MEQREILTLLLGNIVKENKIVRIINYLFSFYFILPKIEKNDYIK